MPDIQPKSSPLALLAGAGWFVAFEVVAFWVLHGVVLRLGQPDPLRPENTIVNDWVKTIAFLVLHLALIIAAMLVLSNRLPRRHRGQLMGWFYLGMLMSFVLLIPLFAA